MTAAGLVGVFGQEAYRGRFEWGVSGAEAIAAGAGFVVVVDVLSFTTTLSVAVEHGIAVMPYRWRDGSAAEVAERYGAELAVGRKVARPDEISLSPAALRRVIAERPVGRLVLPSPNGSAISARFAAGGVTVIGVSLRNAKAAGEWVRARLDGQAVAVVAAGEQWPEGERALEREQRPDGGPQPAGERRPDGGLRSDGGLRPESGPRQEGGLRPESGLRPGGGLRPAVEDLWGAGAFLDGFDDLSPEAEMAVAAYRAVADRVPEALAASASGRELSAIGFAGDVAVAGEIHSTEVVPVLQDGWYRGVRLGGG
ncbi:2-phosphosulfolactate phosphatase [Actinoplanes sp. HUAS TT8]|uniref:2-phosphosulfolactate phosphatase n=1 Tax=Actinoplanes sp. HUAS TT8 TaxID=3447453 RepID=UPI003F526BC7